MLRAMIWMSTITTQRICLIGLMLAVSWRGGFKTVWECEEAGYTFMTPGLFGDGLKAAFEGAYPICAMEGARPDTLIMVSTNFWGSALEFASAARLTFGTSIWVGMGIHIAGLEYYVSSLRPHHNAFIDDNLGFYSFTEKTPKPVLSTRPLRNSLY